MSAQKQEGSSGKVPHHAEQCARFLTADQLRPVTKRQLSQPPNSDSTLLNWSECETSREVLREEDSAEDRQYREQYPLPKSQPSAKYIRN